MMMSKKAPSLVKLCVGEVIGNLRYVGNVGGIEMHLLAEILPHCTVDQLMHIEGSTEESDLSPVTNDLWKRFYEQQFGEENTNLVIKRMAQRQVSFKWRNLYKAKTKEREEFQNKSAERLKQRYEKELAKKQSKQIQICSKIPPSGNKRCFSSVGPTYNVSHIKGNLMKKAKLEYLKSNGAMHAALKKIDLQRRSLPPQRQTVRGIFLPYFPGAIWFQNASLYHFSMFHASHHLTPVMATYTEIEDEISAVRKAAQSICPLKIVLDRVVLTSTGVLLGCWQVMSGPDPVTIRAKLRNALPHSPEKQLYDPVMLHTSFARILGYPKGAFEQEMKSPSDLLNLFHELVSCLNNKLHGFKASVSELWFVEECDLLALALDGRMKLHKFPLACSSIH